MLTDWVSWRWGLFINVPLGAALIWLAPRYLPETPRHRGRFDLPGALTSTIGMTALVYGLVRAAEDGWGNTLTLASFATAAALLAYFVVGERRASSRSRRCGCSPAASGSAPTSPASSSSGRCSRPSSSSPSTCRACRATARSPPGSAFLPMTLSVFAMVRVVPRIAPRIGELRVLAAGLFVALAGMLWLGQISPGADYLTQMAAPLILLGVGIGLGPDAADHSRGRRRRRLRTPARPPGSSTSPTSSAAPSASAP